MNLQDLTVVDMDASELGLAPGEWPKRVFVEGQGFERSTREYDPEGAFVGYRYDCEDADLPLQLVVWND